MTSEGGHRAPFAGRMGRTIADSEPSFEQRPHPGEDAPNVVIVFARYVAPYEFTGTLHQIVVQASPEKYADVGTADARAEMSRQ